MYITKINLKQHSPHIHFQANDSGATIRATEVKPKLDKFLINKLDGIEKAKKQHPIWFPNKDQPALDYALRFRADDKNKVKWSGDEVPMFFGNMGEGEPKDLVFYPKGIELKVITKDKHLIDFIMEHISTFFCLHNFGTRQSKGYGSYSIDEDQIENLYKYKFRIRTNLNKLIQEAEKSENTQAFAKEFKFFMEKVDYFYQSMRSGFNIKTKSKGIYMKPMIFHYLQDKNITWDKKSIKEAFYEEVPEGRKAFKDLFGLSTSENWKGHFKLEKKDVHEQVTRYKSPILFKPIIKDNEATVYFDYFEPDYIEDYIGTIFKTTAIGKNKKVSLKLQIPKDFNFDDFLKYATTFERLDEIIDVSGNGSPFGIKESLMQTYSSIKKELNK